MNYEFGRYVWSSHIARVWINRVRLSILLVVSWTGKMDVSLAPFAPENLVSRDGFGSPVPRHPAHLYTQAESGAYLRDSARFPRRRSFAYLIRHTPSSQSRAYRVTQLPTDGVIQKPLNLTKPLACDATGALVLLHTSKVVGGENKFCDVPILQSYTEAIT